MAEAGWHGRRKHFQVNMLALWGVGGPGIEMLTPRGLNRGVDRTEQSTLSSACPP